MNIDERLEALTHTVELLAAMHKDTDREIQAAERQIKSLGKYVRAIARLSLDHETRLQALEGNGTDEDTDIVED